MDNERTTTYAEPNSQSFSDFDSDSEYTRERLDTLLKINSEYAKEQALYNSEAEKFEAATMQNPISAEKTYTYFGLLLGIFPPAAFFSKIFLSAGQIRPEESWLFILFFLVNAISATVGYFSGKLIGRLTTEMEKLSWHSMILILPFIGLLWGAISGGAGGLVIFIFGVVFGAMIGGAVGSVAFPLFTILHRLFKRGDQIEKKHFLPIAFGITFVISAFILGI